MAKSNGPVVVLAFVKTIAVQGPESDVIVTFEHIGSGLWKIARFLSKERRGGRRRQLRKESMSGLAFTEIGN